MLLLIVYVSVALGFSFLCSIAEAVILSVSSAYAKVLADQGHGSGRLLVQLKSDVSRPLAAILTLNTVAHTVGAAGAGAQAASVFGDAWVGVISAVLTLLILVFSEIIPKSLGARYWRELAPATAYTLRVLILSLYPFVVLSNALTRRLGSDEHSAGMSRQELATVADMSANAGHLAARESSVLKNLFRFSETPACDVMTPRIVVFSVPADMTVAAYFEAHEARRFSRIPIFTDGDRDHVSGFVLRADLLLAQARGESSRLLEEFGRHLAALPERLPMMDVFEQLMRERMHIAMLVDEYGTVAGLVTLEDVLETLIGMEIVDEGDTTVSMRAQARRLWKQRAAEMGIDTARIHESDA